MHPKDVFRVMRDVFYTREFKFLVFIFYKVTSDYIHKPVLCQFSADFKVGIYTGIVSIQVIIICLQKDADVIALGAVGKAIEV